jgi:hypothetical protein
VSFGLHRIVKMERMMSPLKLHDRGVPQFSISTPTSDPCKQIDNLFPKPQKQRRLSIFKLGGLRSPSFSCSSIADRASVNRVERTFRGVASYAERTVEMIVGAFRMAFAVVPIVAVGMAFVISMSSTPTNRDSVTRASSEIIKRRFTVAAAPLPAW